jgi:hypothetical protein
MVLESVEPGYRSCAVIYCRQTAVNLVIWHAVSNLERNPSEKLVDGVFCADHVRVGLLRTEDEVFPGLRRL